MENEPKLTEVESVQAELAIKRGRKMYLEAAEVTTREERAEIRELGIRICELQIWLDENHAARYPENLPNLTRRWAAENRHTGDPAFGS